MNTPKKQKRFLRYKNLGGKSTVSRFEILKDIVTVKFTDSSCYNYSNQSAGVANIEQMKKLAAAGKGLGTFITANLKDKWMRKIR